MEYKINKKENNTYEINVTVEKITVQKHLDEALKHEAENATIEGFRKGKAPLNVVKEKIDPATIRSHALNHIISEVYGQILKESKLQPIISPRFEIKTYEEDQDLVFVATVVEKPEIKLGDYKSEIQKKYDEKAKNNKEDGDIVLDNTEIIDAIVGVSTIGIPEVLVDEETNRMMSSLIEQTAQLGITIDQYLESQTKKIDELRAEYKATAESNIKGDFLLTEIALTDGLTVTDEEIEITINSIPDEKSREELAKPEQKMYIRAVLMKNKTLDMLRNLPNENKEKKNDTKKDKKKSDKKEEPNKSKSK